MPVLGRASMGSFGDRLKKQREQRGISLDDIALSTKIGTRMLRALEEEKFEQLPGGIFNKGFVRAYARHVGHRRGTDHQRLHGRSGRSAAKLIPIRPSRAPGLRHVTEPGPVAPILDPPERERSAEIPWGLLALALLLVALAFATWSYYHRERKAETSSATLAPRAGKLPAESRTARKRAADSDCAHRRQECTDSRRSRPRTSPAHSLRPCPGRAARLGIPGTGAGRVCGFVEGQRGRRVLGLRSWSTASLRSKRS